MNNPRNEEAYFDYAVGKRVIVVWADEKNDWIAFRLIWEDCGFVKLQGVSSPDGTPHDGSFVICKVDEIRNMIEWKHEDSKP